MRNIQLISDSYLCSACGACYAACPKEAIIFKESSLGRKYAYVTDTCIECGICQKICPSIDILDIHSRYDDMFVGDFISVKVGKSQNYRYYNNAQSGGAVATILDYLFETKLIDAAVVTQMDYGQIPEVKGKIITCKSEIFESQKSCYTPVALLKALRNTERYSAIAIVGLPCHIEGSTLLKETLKSFSNIKYKIGLICDRTMCAGIMSAFRQIAKIDSEIKIDWRRKSFFCEHEFYPYKTAPVVVSSKEGHEKMLNNQYRFALKDMFTAPRCRVCADKLNLHADIVCGDPWGMSDIDWNGGESLIITRSVLGDNLVKDIENKGLLKLSNRPIEQVLYGQHISRKSLYLSAYRKAFISVVNKDAILHNYLCNASGSVDNRIFRNAIQEYKVFVSNESLSREDVVNKAINTVKKHFRNVSVSDKLWYKIVKKIKHILVL